MGNKPCGRREDEDQKHRHVCIAKQLEPVHAAYISQCSERGGEGLHGFVGRVDLGGEGDKHAERDAAAQRALAGWKRGWVKKGAYVE